MYCHGANGGGDCRLDEGSGIGYEVNNDGLDSVADLELGEGRQPSENRDLEILSRQCCRHVLHY